MVSVRGRISTGALDNSKNIVAAATTGGHIFMDSV